MRSHMKKKGAVLLGALGLAIAVAACGSNPATSSTTTTTGGAPAGSGMATLKVALVEPSATNDLAFSQSMYSALEGLASSDHLQISVSANEFVVSDAANIIRQYASEGYNLIIAHGSQYGSIVEQLAPQFPHVSFAWGTAGATFGLSNVFAYEAASNEGGYVQGYMAAMLSKSKVLGIIGPIATGDAKLYVDGFVAGAKAEDPSITAHPVYTGSFSDDSLMATAARTFVSNGADVLTGSSQSVVGAIGVASAHNMPWFSTQWSQASLAPHNVVSAQVYNWVPILTQMITSIRAGKYGGATYVIGLGNGGETIAFNSGYMLPANVKTAAEHLITEITDGTITPPQ